MSDDTNDLVAVQVNEEVCIGAGQCEMFEEDTFYVDDDTVIAKVVGTGMLPRDRAEKVVQMCPSSAISIIRSPVEEPQGDGSGLAAREEG